MIREAVVEDAPAIANLIVLSWQTAFTNIIDPEYPKSLDVNRYINIMTDNIQHKKEKIFVFEDGGRGRGENKGEVKGFVSGKVGKPADKSKTSYQCEVMGLYVHPDMHGQGIGGLLLNRIKHYFTEQGYQKCILWTLEGARNNSFYIKQQGTPLEHKTLTLGDSTYPAVGFVFDVKA